MSELVLITNWISTFIQSKFGLDGVALQIINSFTIKFLALSERIVRNINIENQIMNANTEHLLNAIYKVVIFSSILYMAYITYKHRKSVINYWNIYITKKEIADEPKIEVVSMLEPGSESVVPRVYYKTDITNIQSLIITITRFMQLHPEFFQTDINKRIINYNDTENYYIYEDPIIFNDKIHNTFGYITTSYKETKDGDKIVKTFTIIIYIDKESKNTKCYTKLLEDYIEHELKHGNRVKLNYYKILNRQLITHTFYDKSISEWFSDVKRLKQEFFLKQAKYLFSIFDKKNSSNNNTAWNNLILWGKAGSGKCLSKDTPVLMHSGKINKVQDIKIGELVMGDDSKPRKVLSLARGKEQMYKIEQGHDSYTVNKNHILSLVYSINKQINHKENKHSYQVKWFDNTTISNKSICFNYENENKLSLDKAYQNAIKFEKLLNENLYIDISVEDYIKLATTNKTLFKNLKGYKVGVEFEEQKVELDPYILGIWLGGIHIIPSTIIIQEYSILKYLVSKVSEYNCYMLKFSESVVDNYSINSLTEYKQSEFIDLLKKYNVLDDNKHIPKIYKINSREIRLQILAGLIDIDGSYYKTSNSYEICQKNNTFTEDI